MQHAHADILLTLTNALILFESVEGEGPFWGLHFKMADY